MVSLHVPLMPSTDGLIGARELGLMKPTAILINTCRGQVVDEAALLDTLRHRRIYGAGIDVFQEEPTPADNPLLELDNVTVGPHMAGRSGESFPRRVEFAFENMARVWAGGRTGKRCDRNGLVQPIMIIKRCRRRAASDGKQHNISFQQKTSENRSNQA